MKDLIEKIIMDEELTRQEKQVLVSIIVKASRNQNEYITPNYFIHSEVIENNNIDMKLWHRNIEIDGKFVYTPTNFDNNQIIDFMKKEILVKKKTK